MRQFLAWDWVPAAVFPLDSQGMGVHQVNGSLPNSSKSLTMHIDSRGEVLRSIQWEYPRKGVGR